MTVRSLANRRKAAAGMQILQSIPSMVSPASRFHPANLVTLAPLFLNATIRRHVRRTRVTFQSVQEIGLSETTKCERSRAEREPSDGRE